MYTSTASSRRGEKSTRKREDRLQAVLIAEPFRSALGPHSAYPLSPVTPSVDLPFALLPICNTPLIDYVLENLLENSVDEVTILLSSYSMPAVSAHLNNNRTSRGKPWTAFDTIKVTLMECGTHMHKLADAVRELRDRNAVPQSGSFVFVPIDCVAFLPHLRDYFAVHLERVQTIPKYAATLLCTQSSRALRATLHNVLLHASASGAGDADTSLLDEPTSPYGSNLFPGTSFMVMEPVRLPIKSVPERPREHHTMFVVDESNQVVTYMARLEPTETMAEPPLLSFSRKTRHAVRMDLTPTGFLFCCCEALALIEFHITDVYAFLGTALLGNVGVYGNVFGIIPVRPDSSQRCTVVDPINSLEAYIQANLDVSARRLFPLTRESCFAEMRATYAVSAVCETVYIHTTAKVMDHGSLGPNVVIGAHVRVPVSVRLTGTVLGGGVQLGERSSLLGCVVLPDAVIGAGCVLRGCLIGAGARVADGTELVNAIVGSGCEIAGSPSRMATAVGMSNNTTTNNNTNNNGNNNTTHTKNIGSAVIDEDEDEQDDGGCHTSAARALNRGKQVSTATGSRALRLPRATNRTRHGSHSSGSRDSDAEGDVNSSSSEEEGRAPLARRGDGCAEDSRWVNDILPTSGLFIDDAVPQARRRRQTRNSGAAGRRRVGAGARRQSRGRAGRAAGAANSEDELDDTVSESDDEEEGEDDEDEESDASDDSEETDEEDSDASGAAASVDEWEEFSVAIRPYVDKALRNPLQIEASSYDMNTVCLSHGFGYPELSETVTEQLMEYVLQTTRAAAESGDMQAVLDTAREVLAQWCRPFYNALLSKNKSMNIDAMVATLEGLCASICESTCPLYPYGAVLMEIMYNDCDDDMYNERGYCIVSGEGLIAFDEAMRRRGEIIAQHSKQRQQQRTQAAGQKRSEWGGGNVVDDNDEGENDDEKEEEEEDEDRDSDDVLEEKKIAMAQLCHDFIMGVRDFLEGA